MNRRIFLEWSGSAAIGSMVSSELLEDVFFKEFLSNIGIQLYTVRDDMARNPVDTLRTIKGIGYSHIESAGYENGKFYRWIPREFKMLLDELGLKMHSGHCSTGFGKPDDYVSMSNNWEKLCEDAAFMGQKYIVCGYFEEGERKTIDQYKKHAANFNTCGEVAKKFGLTFCHHNHDFEFLPIDGKIPYDILLNETDPSLVKFELDHYWVEKANVNASKLIKKNKGRFPLFHIKDMAKTEDRSFTEVGSGIIDWKKVFKMKKDAGMELFYVEQDTCKTMKPLESVDVSYKFLKQLSI